MTSQTRGEGPVAQAPGATGSVEDGPEVPARAIYATYGLGFSGNAVTTMLKVVVPLWAIHLNLSATEIGFAIGMSALLPFLLSIHGGVLMDKLGTRPVTFAYAVTTALMCPLIRSFPCFPPWSCYSSSPD